MYEISYMLGKTWQATIFRLYIAAIKEICYFEDAHDTGYHIIVIQF